MQHIDAPLLPFPTSLLLPYLYEATPASGSPLGVRYSLVNMTCVVVGSTYVCHSYMPHGLLTARGLQYLLIVLETILNITVNEEHMWGSSCLAHPLPPFPGVSQLASTQTSSAFTFQTDLGRIDQFAPATSSVGVPLVSFTHGCLVQM